LYVPLSHFSVGAAELRHGRPLRDPQRGCGVSRPRRRLANWIIPPKDSRLAHVANAHTCTKPYPEGRGMRYACGAGKSAVSQVSIVGMQVIRTTIDTPAVKRFHVVVLHVANPMQPYLFEATRHHRMHTTMQSSLFQASAPPPPPPASPLAHHRRHSGDRGHVGRGARGTAWRGSSS